MNFGGRDWGAAWATARGRVGVCERVRVVVEDVIGGRGACATIARRGLRYRVRIAGARELAGSPVRLDRSEIRLYNLDGILAEWLSVDRLGN